MICPWNSLSRVEWAGSQYSLRNIHFSGGCFSCKLFLFSIAKAKSPGADSLLRSQLQEVNNLVPRLSLPDHIRVVWVGKNLGRIQVLDWSGEIGCMGLFGWLKWLMIFLFWFCWFLLVPFQSGQARYFGNRVVTTRLLLVLSISPWLKHPIAAGFWVRHNLALRTCIPCWHEISNVYSVHCMLG